MIERRSLEEALAQFDDIVRRYRNGVGGVRGSGGGDVLSREAAIAQLMKLHFTAGEAMRLLRHPNAH